VFLAVDEAVLFLRVVGMAAFDLMAFLLDGTREGAFHLGLGSPAILVGGKAKVAVCYENDRLAHVGSEKVKVENGGYYGLGEAGGKTMVRGRPSCLCFQARWTWARSRPLTAIW
jgi:hypothetical protein